MKDIILNSFEKYPDNNMLGTIHQLFRNDSLRKSTKFARSRKNY
jgi:hypothetical protein